MKNIFIILTCLYFFYSPFLHSQNAPVTTAARVINATPGDPSVPIPVTVTGFTNIGKLTLTMLFDTTRVRYVSASPHPSLTGMTATYSSPVDNNYGKLVIAWTGASNVSLADGTSIIDLTFRYITGTGLLIWDYSIASQCQYKQGLSMLLTRLTQ